MKRFLGIACFMLFAIVVNAQNITAKVIDAQSGESLPYANIELNGQNIISNAEGSFTIPPQLVDDNQTLSITFLGYSGVRMDMAELKKNQWTIKMNPAVFELETLHISNTTPNADSIMAYVKKNLARNYKLVAEPVKNTIFYRESQTFRPQKVNVEITKSTGYKKKELDDTNKQLQGFTSKLISHPPQEFKEMLINYYTSTKKVNDKPQMLSKFEVAKAIQLKDKNRAVSLKEMQEMVTGIVYKHLDSTKYYRIKSGWFGTRDTVLKPQDAKKIKTKENIQKATSHDVAVFIHENNFTSGTHDFVTNTGIYDYFYQGAVPHGDQYVYVLKFKPRKSKAKYTGTLYISDNDYAIVKAEYELAEGKTLSGVNLKFLLGIKQSENMARGSMVFKENLQGGGYYLHYASQETGQYVYLNRPLKFIEIAKSDKDVAAFDLKLETNIIEKKEYFNISRAAVSEAAFNVITNKEANYLQLESYSPSIWKEYTTVDPVQEMKQFRVYE
ncbi:carboxypeptidase-like regulatory domain-containing protein [Flavobacterium sp. Sd200]|uniref:carboxypeptidase-like regulatory domain-containing protein n=1 Tax=Flavobacterium sp. Sd200 TaxID=2692211 RepID=UPI0013711933|nr:carboxypeptidase-like regulatory domain-containing protein [Flavobacterium sp. Sd200]MXN92881.1 carboxypeptidase-like regulatory domain-containing protein [Flavobacterium sp. Sd200]